MRIGVFCSGGDAPGMNACVMAVVRAANHHGHQVVGIKRGYQGLLEEDFFLNTAGQPVLTLRRASVWSQFGGAFLRSSRSDEFRTEQGQQKAAEILRRHDIDGLIAIGGDGTFQGAVALSKFWDGQIIGCPGTIDNDLVGTDYTIGFSTAVQTAVEAVDKIRDTAWSHDRMFLIEVMGRHSGYIAAYTAIATGADAIAIPETETDCKGIVRYLQHLKSQGKNSTIMIVAEGDERGGVSEIIEHLENEGCPYPMRTVVLGHLQRGGTPTPEDRRRATQMGAAAVKAILNGQTGMMAGTRDDQCVLTPLVDTFASHRTIPPSVLELLHEMTG
ncbi:MAG: 6-phosphofructokinase [Mariniblastus sp.]|nr:6-phosphofructokinase [Mariniblastus sp.]